ncbi:MAG: glycine oxidase ThiO [Pseudomonadota bacterium]|nr:MAG: glycine oxidase ThiO [Pseudomonadota bacterium]
MKDCVVVGGGLIGMLVARALTDEGAQVTVLERGATGRESSWAGGGILSPLYPWRYADAVTRLAGWGQARYALLTQELRARTGIDPEWTQSGLLISDMAAETSDVLAWGRRFDVEARITDLAEAKQIEPALGEVDTPLLWLPSVAQVRNPRLMKALRADLDARGVHVREQAAVTGLMVESGRVNGVRLNGETVACGTVVIASGAWSAELLEPLGLHLPVVPVRGQMLLFRGAPGLVRRIVLSRDRYVIPRRDGRVLVGSTLEHVGFNKGTTGEARQELEAESRRIVPALANCEVERHWAGLRPGSPDGIPIIGEHPGIEGLYVNAGHFRNGVVLGPASARLLVDLITGAQPLVDPAPYQPRVMAEAV